MAGGSAPWEGNVEVCFSGRWGTICHDRWDQIDAQTTCRILGFGNGSMAIATRRAFFGIQPDRPIFLDEVGCLGNETGILQCASVDVGNHNCNHFLDAGVICSGERVPTNYSLEIVIIMNIATNYSLEIIIKSTKLIAMYSWP